VKPARKTLIIVMGMVLAAVLIVVAERVYVVYTLAKVDFFAESNCLERNLSLAEANRRCRFPLPASATNISFAEWRMGMGYEFYIRFEAPAQTCLAHVPAALAFGGKSGGATSMPTPVLAPITAPPSAVRSPSLDLSWFDVESIRNGVKTDGGSSHVATVWVDTDRGVFYYMVTD
jgi:hypothetical protein